LALGEKLQAQDRDAEAVENYRRLLEEAPDYLGKISVLNKLELLQQKVAETNTSAQP
jgi:hypothetical protein